MASIRSEMYIAWNVGSCLRLGLWCLPTPDALAGRHRLKADRCALQLRSGETLDKPRIKMRQLRSALEDGTF